ncbi:hypothetical protein ACTIVE_5381 [Actinomadura verrucosospora]|uniref:Uncharacterized protein n=1 Tax=Actinomadura verrucosospora TaxID=46165 RepID=A0A7D3VVD4_ACTVE|nr:hypothetical protein ACTIVE_5381 [Actinomadura verrucosospora]
MVPAYRRTADGEQRSGAGDDRACPNALPHWTPDDSPSFGVVAAGRHPAGREGRSRGKRTKSGTRRMTASQVMVLEHLSRYAWTRRLGATTSPGSSASGRQRTTSSPQRIAGGGRLHHAQAASQDAHLRHRTPEPGGQRASAMAGVAVVQPAAAPSGWRPSAR